MATGDSNGTAATVWLTAGSTTAMNGAVAMVVAENVTKELFSVSGVDTDEVFYVSGGKHGHISFSLKDFSR